MALSITQYQVNPGTAVALGPGLPAGPYYALISAGSAASSGIYLTYTGATAPSTAGMYIPGGAAGSADRARRGAGVAAVRARVVGDD